MLQEPEKMAQPISNHNGNLPLVFDFTYTKFENLITMN